MPHPMFLKVMGITIHEYNSYSPAKKERFQKAAAKKVGEIHQSDMEKYTKLTSATAFQAKEDAQELSESEAEDKENS